MKRKIPAIFAVTVGILLLLIIVIIALPGPDTPTEQIALTWEELRDTPLTDDEVADPISVCQQFVKDRLKSPSTASFPWSFADYQTNRLIDPPNSYNVEGFVDAQNSFGAKLRSNFTCKVEKGVGDQWLLIQLDIAEPG